VPLIGGVWLPGVDGHTALAAVGAGA
jgi:hypothetical protein